MIKRFLAAAAALLIAASPTQAQSASETTPKALLEAYKKEFAFLEAERDALNRRLRQINGSLKTKEVQAAGQIKRLQLEVIESREAIEKLEKEIGSLQSKVDKDTDDKDRLEETLFRARQTLEEAGFSLPEDFKKAPKFDKAEAWNAHYENVFGWAKELIGARAAITKTKGSFFLEGGEKIDGDIVRVGGVAAYGVSDKASGALVPAGAGQLKMWVHDASATAKALSEGKTDLAELGIFLVDRWDKQVDPPEEKTWQKTVESGGVIAWVIVYLGVFGLLLIVLRLIWLGVASLGSAGQIKAVTASLEKGDVQGASAYLTRKHTSTAKVMLAALKSYDATREQAENAISEAVVAQTSRVERFGAFILVIAAVAPLLGLLGTVTGMISTFDIITEHGTGDPKLLSGGISEALITTELGLIVAIPTLIVGTLLGAAADRIGSHMEEAALRVLNTRTYAPGTGYDPTGTESDDNTIAMTGGAGEMSEPPELKESA